MKPRALIIALLLIAALLLVRLMWPPAAPQPATPATPPAPVRSEDPPTPADPTGPSGPSIGEEILKDYASPAHPPAHDLELVRRLVISFRHLVKQHASLPIGGNADLTAALLGNNPSKQVFLPATFPHLSPGKDPQLLDRWGTPLIVHPVAADRYELRSAGPDKTPYNADDLELVR